MGNSKVKIIDRYLEVFHGPLESDFDENYDVTRIYDRNGEEIMQMDWGQNNFYINYNIIGDLQNALEFEELDYLPELQKLFKEYSSYAFGYKPNSVFTFY